MPVADYLNNPVDQQILNELAARNSKHIERADEQYKDLGTVNIFNVGPVPYVISLGGLGMFTIPTCPEGRIYSEPLQVWKLYPEGRTEDMNKIIEITTNGHAIAEAIVGYGKFMHPSSDMRKVGIFTAGAFVTVKHPSGQVEKLLASEVKTYQKKHKGAVVVNTRKVTDAAIKAARKNGDEREASEIKDDILAANLPTEEEINDAHLRLNEYCSELVSEANDYYRNNELKEIQKLHRWAAIRTNNLDLPWVKTSLIMEKCGVCGNQLMPDVAICMGCKSIVPGKEDIIKARKVPGYEHLWATPEAKTEKSATK